MLSSLADDPTMKLKAGEARPAEEVFGELVPFARKQRITDVSGELFAPVGVATDRYATDSNPFLW